MEGSSRTRVNQSGGVPKPKAGGNPRIPSVANVAYQLFCSEERLKIKESEPAFNVNQVNSELGRRWRECPGDRKQKYFDEALSRKTQSEFSRRDHGGSTGSNVGPVKPVAKKRKANSATHAPEPSTSTATDIVSVPEPSTSTAATDIVSDEYGNTTLVKTVTTYHHQDLRQLQLELNGAKEQLTASEARKEDLQNTINDLREQLAEAGAGKEQIIADLRRECQEKEDQLTLSRTELAALQEKWNGAKDFFS